MENLDNFNKYWRNWNVLQTPKFDVDNLRKAGWKVNDVNKGDEHQTLLVKDDKKIRIVYFNTGGVSKLVSKDGDTVLKSQKYSFILKPTVNDIRDFLLSVGIEDWERFYTAV